MQDIMDHIEAYHTAGISIPCNICERVFKSRNSLSGHTFKKHEKKKLTDDIIDLICKYTLYIYFQLK